MIWFYWQNQKRSSDFFRKVLSWRIKLCEKTTKNYNKNGIGSDDAPSSSYAILFFRDIYWISLTKVMQWTPLCSINVNMDFKSLSEFSDKKILSDHLCVFFRSFFRFHSSDSRYPKNILERNYQTWSVQNLHRLLWKFFTGSRIKVYRMMEYN